MNSRQPSEDEIFERASQLAGEQRAVYLEEVVKGDEPLRQRIGALLEAQEQAGDFLKVPITGISSKTRLITTNMIPVTEKAGDKIGRYKLREQIGEGGCGVVYVAEQEEPVRRRVALKVIKLGMDTKQVVARFEAERQALALLDHPNIAKVLDAGATSTGRPYFVMELVRGIKITDYCDKDNLSTEDRLKLFIQVCAAVQHGHQKGIIHLDIKPSNILVTLHDGVPVPKVIDFGIAKATTDQRLTDRTIYTAFEQFIGTPAYISPEQAEMSGLDIDTRSDIYSLGVLLYELLTGRTPFDAAALLKAGLDQMRRIIREQEPQRPSTRLIALEDADLNTVAQHRRSEPPRLVSLIRGDLDWIVMKALEKDRTRRYETASGLAMDLKRHLDNEPVVARTPSQFYLFVKFIRRSKLLAAAIHAVATVRHLGCRRDPKSEIGRAYGLNDVQFTVYRPATLLPETWTPMLVFTHLTELPPDAKPDEPNPIKEVQRQAEAVLGEKLDSYRQLEQESTRPIPRSGLISLVPVVQGIEFNPPERSFRWEENVHREEFKMRAPRQLEGQIANGSLMIYYGTIVLASVTLNLRVTSRGVEPGEKTFRKDKARRFRKIFASYSHQDTPVVEQLEAYAKAVGDEFLRDVSHLQVGEVWNDRLQEMIRQADVFQLFWSRHSMCSPFVEREWRYALGLNREQFILPVYWEQPLPEDLQKGLPPEDLRRLHFHRLGIGTEPSKIVEPKEQEAAIPTAESQKNREPSTALAEPEVRKDCDSKWHSSSDNQKSCWPKSDDTTAKMKSSDFDESQSEATGSGRFDDKTGTKRGEKYDSQYPNELKRTEDSRGPSANPQSADPNLSKKRQIQPQKFIARNRAPRVQIEYDVELYGAEKKVELPFVVGVMADLAGKHAQPFPPVSDRRFLEIDVDNFDHRLKASKPRVSFQVPNTLEGEGSLDVDITFESLNDFSPSVVARKIEPLKKLLEARQQLADLLTSLDGKSEAEMSLGEIMKNPKLLESLAKRPPPESSPDFAEVTGEKSFQNALSTLAQQALVSAQLVSNDAAKTISAIIGEIDRKLTRQINPIIHHEDFKTLEGTWRGLYYLVSHTETDELLKIRILNLSKRELDVCCQKFKGSAWDQNPLFKKIYEEEFGMPGGQPFGCLVGDYYFDHSVYDVATLTSIAQLAAVAHAPFIGGAGPTLMGMESWQELSNPPDLTKKSQTSEYSAWRSLREAEDSRFLGLTIPRFLARLSYGAKTNLVEDFAFEEDVESGGDKNYVWANAAYAIAANITRSFKLYGWCARISGVETGGTVEGLPISAFSRDNESLASKRSTEIDIIEQLEDVLAKIGLVTLCHRKNLDCAVFLSAQSLHKPGDHHEDATANADSSTQLPYLFGACRFAIQLKCMVQDRLGSFRSEAELLKWMNDWLAQYVCTNPEATEDVKAQRPLLRAEVISGKSDGKPDCFNAELVIRPQYQLEAFAAPIQLSLILPSLP